jgi:hypothetical protein
LNWKHFANYQVPAWNDRVRKTECVLSFDTPESTNGLFVSLTTFQGFGNDYVDLDYRQNQNPLYLWIKWNKIAKPVAAKADGLTEPTKLGIGIEGGFQVEDEPFEFEKTHFLAIMPSRVLIPFPNAELPDLIDLSIQAIFKASDLSESDAQVPYDSKSDSLSDAICQGIGQNVHKLLSCPISKSHAFWSGWARLSSEMLSARIPEIPHPCHLAR